MTMNGNGQEYTPQRLGDLRIQRVADGWDVFRDGRRIVAGLSKAAMLQLIRGEQTLAGILEATHG